MESENKSKKKIPVIVICILLIGIFLVGGISYYLHQKDKTLENIYYLAIDNFKEYLIKNINDTSRKYTNTLGSKGNIKMELQTEDNKLDNIFNILNNTLITYDSETNIINNIGNIKLGLNYKNAKVADINCLIKNNDAFLLLENIYDKPIKIADNDFSTFWNKIDLNNFRTIINELSKIIKNNLKKEYFTIENANDITNYILFINKHDLNSYRNNLIESIKYNNSLLMALSSITNKSIDEIKNKIDEQKKEFQNIENDLKITTKMNKNSKITNVTIEYGNTYIIDNLKDNTYEIKTLDNGKYVKLGILEIKKDYFKIDYEKDKIKINGNISNQDNELIFTINVTNGNENYYISNNINNNKGLLNASLNNLDYNIKLTIDYELKNIEKVNEFDVSNYIESSMIKEEDGNKIISNLMNNDGAKTLVSDLITSNLGSLIFGSFGSGTEEANI